MTKRRKTNEEPAGSQQQDEDFIPLPIQTFLWRQTSPFVRPFLGKARDLAQIEQRDACKLFERIIITNNIWGQSPSLTDAIASIDRWRLIRVSFPFVLQCTAALLNNKLIKDHTFNRLGGNEAKMMYTLQWILMNASEECADSEKEAKNNAINVAFAAATAASLLKPSGQVGTQVALASQASTSSTSTNLDHHLAAPASHLTAPNSAILGARTQSQSPPASQPVGRPAIVSANVISSPRQTRGGSSSSCANQSIIIPAASAAASIAAVASPSGMSTLQMQTALPSSSSVSPIGSSTPTKPLTPTNPAPINPGNYLLPISSIQMFVYYFAPIMDGLKHSDFLTTNQRLEIGAALWEPLFNHQLPNIQCLMAPVKPKKAKLDPCSAFFASTEPVYQGASRLTGAPVASNGLDWRRSSLVMLDAQAKNNHGSSKATNIATKTAHQKAGEMIVMKGVDLVEDTKLNQASAAQGCESYYRNSYATYLDVAVLRCLFICDWQESGVYWAVTYLSNRLAELNFCSDYGSEIKYRFRSKSLSAVDGECCSKTIVKTRQSRDEPSGYPIRVEDSSRENSPLGKHTVASKTFAKSIDEQMATRSRFLRVEDAETSDSGGDNTLKEPKSPARRLSFTSGMQTLANQIRKTSKRVKKTSDKQQLGNEAMSGSQSNINLNPTVDGKWINSMHRRSSSADDLSSNQIFNLASMHNDSLSQGRRDNHKFTESNPVITVTANTQKKQQSISGQGCKQDRKLQKKGRKERQTGGARMDPQFLTQALYAKSVKRLDRLVRSQTVPSNMRYSPYETKRDHADQTESIGATHYVDDIGRIDPIVVLKVSHSMSQRETCCSQRVCDRILCLVTRLINFGVLKEGFNSSRRVSYEKDLTTLLPTRQHDFTPLLHNKPQILKTGSDRIDQQKHSEDASLRAALIHKILIDITVRLYHHLGCPNHCGMESTIDHHNRGHGPKFTSLSGKSSSGHSGNDVHSGKILRAKLRETLEFLCNHNRQNFITYMQTIIEDRALQQVVDVLHSILGFCRSDYLVNLNQTYNSFNNSSAGTIHGQSVQFKATSSTSNTNFNEISSQNGPNRPLIEGTSSSHHSDLSGIDVVGRQQGSASSRQPSTQLQSGITAGHAKISAESVESVIVTCSFKLLITRMASMNKELKLQENTSLYCDIRRLISFIRDNYQNLLRSIVLSALIDCAKILSQQQRCDSSNLKRPGDFTRSPSDDDSTGAITASVGLRRDKNLADHCGVIDYDGDRIVDASTLSYSSSAIQQSPLGLNQDGSPILQHRTSAGSYRFYPPGSQRSSKHPVSTQDQQSGQSAGISSLSKAKRKLEQVFGAKAGNKTKLNSSHLGEDLAQSGSIGPCDGEQLNLVTDHTSRRASIAGHQSVGSFHETNTRNLPSTVNNNLPLEAQLTNIDFIRHNRSMYTAVQVGLANFSFLMESCSPNDFLDPALLAALLDLKSPICIRAAIYLECANFVHRCNRGQWPSWMKMNVSSIHRNSNTGVTQSLSSSKFRKSSSIQRTARNNTLMYRAAGRAFYCWAEAIGARLEELLQNEKDLSKEEAIIEDTENDETLPISEQETMMNNHLGSDIDFFQPAIGNNCSPFALKMAACQLLFEVTTFLRETYRYLPPTIVHHQTATSKLGDKMTSIYDVSRAVTANRRWSMALSSLGFGQLPATLSAMSSGSSAAAPVASNHLKHPNSSSISEQPERRISFILHETNDENDQHSKNSKDATPSQTEAYSTQAFASPLAPSVNSVEQQQDAMKKMTAGRHLSQSSASSAVVVAAATCLLRSSGVIESQSHRRKSIKLRKQPQEREQRDKRTKFAQDLDEEIEISSISDAGIRRSDSMRSRRRVSGISEKSDTSERVNSGTQHIGQDALLAGDLSGDESAGNGSCEDAYTTESTDKFEADESRIMSNMPWFKAISMVNSNIDCNCSHFPSCTTFCYKLHQNMCKKLISCVQSIYQDSDDEQNYATSIFESRLSNLMNLGNQQRASSQDSKNMPSNNVRAESDCSTSMFAHPDQEPKRKEKKSKKNLTDPSHGEFSHISPRLRKRHDKSNNRMCSMMSFHLDSFASGTGISSMMTDAVKALTAAKAKKRATAQQTQEEPPIVKYMKASVKSLLHCPMSSFLKGAVILSRDHFLDMIKFSWNLLLEDDQQLSRTAAVCFIISSIKCPTEAAKMLMDELESSDASRKIAAINKFYIIWDARYQCWPRLEDGAFVHFKMTPPSIEFTLPSPKIAQESKPVVDPPWMPRKTSNVEEVTIGQDQTVQKSFVTATKTRRKQQIEIVTKALREKHDKLREDRENYYITSVPITLYAAYEPTLGNQAGGDEMDGGGTTLDDDNQQENRALLQMKTAQALFPTCLCQAAMVMINLLDDSRVTYEGSAVYEIASKVVWSCLVEDPALFLRHFFERLTRQNQSTIFQVLRRLIRFMPRLPPQAAYTLYNYLIGFVIYYIRCPIESSQKLISETLSVLCLVVPSVYGLFLKDLKQILRKEQCDHNLLITANVASAKKIIVHGSDSSGIPSQFPIDETTQFYHILVDSLEFFGIDKLKQNEYFLIDVRTNHMHNLHSYVRDYYSFKRSQHPQLQLINMDPNKAFDLLQKQELINQFMEFGKVSMSLSIVKSSHMAVQRVLFLHEELMKLPTFPRKALETNFCLFRGPLGQQVFSMDRIHKICWVRVIARMFELTSGFFLQLGDIHLFLNAISGIFVLHCEEASVSRLCLATFINATHQFKSIFATDGFMPIMATIVQVYSNHQNNQLLCRSIEFVCKQFYIMHRKPFLLQLFGSVAPRLNTAEVSQQNQSNHPLATNQPSGGTGGISAHLVLNDPSRISPAAFFRLLQSLEKAFKDPLDILELVDAEKPLRAIDFCYQQDKEAIEILDIISLCVTVTAYASESPRSTQMLIILDTVVPLYMKYLQASTSKKAGQSMGKQAHKDELQKIQSVSICIRTLIVNCEGLTRNFNGPLPSIDLRSSSIRRTGAGGSKANSNQHRVQNDSANSPIDYPDEPSNSGPERCRLEQISGHASDHKQTGPGGVHKGAKNYNTDESEITRGEFIVPRDTLLNLVAEFLSLSTGRLVESAKKYVELHQKHSSYELLDVKSHLRLAEVANSLLKFASTDPSVMACRGLTRYMNEILPNTEWRQEAIRPALIMILKRLDKTFNRIAKKTWIKRSTDWEGAKLLLKGAYLTFIKHPYIVHLPHLKSLINCCQNIILNDGIQTAGQTSSNLFHNFTNPQTGVVVSQSASVIPQQVAERQTGNLLSVSQTGYTSGSSLTPSGSGGLHPASAPTTAYQSSHAPSFSTSTAAERTTLYSAPTSSIISQGFNAVTIRLIAMQLLQTGDSQTLENFIGNSMNTPEKLESLMLNLIYPMCIRVCSGAREAPKLRGCDIMLVLNLVLNMLAPQSASSRSCPSTNNSPKVATDTSQFILSKITTTIGSTQTGATALGMVGSSSHSTASAHQLAQHQDGLKIGFLGLKILCVCFESQLSSEWIRISRVIRDLALQTGQPSGPLWDFLDFIATYRFPIFILLLPVIKCHLAKKVRGNTYDENTAHHIQCQKLINAKIQGVAPTVCRSKSFLFVSLTAELRMLKEQLIAKRRLMLEGERHSSSQPAQQSQLNQTGTSSSTPNQASGEASQQADHFTAYHRLSAAIASFANQGAQGRMGPPGCPGSIAGQSGTSAALKGACFAAQLATSAPLGSPISEASPSAVKRMKDSRNEPSQSSIKLSTAKSREEARKVMNTILRRTSYPHNQPALGIPEQQAHLSSPDRKSSQPQSPSSSSKHLDLESGEQGQQIIMDPAMLIAAFPPPRKPNVEGSGILRQLIQNIDRQNQKQQQSLNQQPTSTASEEKIINQQATSSGAKRLSAFSETQLFGACSDRLRIAGSRSQGFAGNTSHRHAKD